MRCCGLGSGSSSLVIVRGTVSLVEENVVHRCQGIITWCQYHVTKIHRSGPMSLTAELRSVCVCVFVSVCTCVYLEKGSFCSGKLTISVRKLHWKLFSYEWIPNVPVLQFNEALTNIYTKIRNEYTPK